MRKARACSRSPPRAATAAGSARKISANPSSERASARAYNGGGEVRVAWRGTRPPTHVRSARARARGPARILRSSGPPGTGGKRFSPERPAYRPSSRRRNLRGSTELGGAPAARICRARLARANVGGSPLTRRGGVLGKCFGVTRLLRPRGVVGDCGVFRADCGGLC